MSATWTEIETNENGACETLHITANNRVAVATNHETLHLITSTPLEPVGQHIVTLIVRGIALTNENILVGLAPLTKNEQNETETFQKRNQFEKKIGSTNDCHGIGSSKYVFNNQVEVLQLYPFNDNCNVIRIIIENKQNNCDIEFFLNNRLVKRIDNIIKASYQVLVHLINGSVLINPDVAFKSFAPQDFDVAYEMELKNEDGKEYEIKRDTMKQFIQMKRKKFLNILYNNANTCRFLLAGEPGAGKSSYKNLLFTSSFLGRETLSEPLKIAKVRSSVFVQNDKSCVTSSIIEKQIPKTKIFIRDCFGMKTEGQLRYVADWKPLLLGQILPKYCKDVSLQDQLQYYKKNVTEDEQIHCVFIVISATEVSANNDATLKTAAEFLKVTDSLGEDGISRIIILTHIDKIGNNAIINGRYERDFNIEHVYQNPLVYQKACIVANTLGVNLNDIIPIQNYESQNNAVRLNYFNDLLALYSLSRGVLLAQQKNINFDFGFDGGDDGEKNFETKS